MISRWQLHRAVQTIRKGGVIAYPTEAVWGLGCDPWNKQAVQRILDIKQRPVHKGLILVTAEIKQLAWLLDGLTTEQRQLLEASWPGPIRGWYHILAGYQRGSAVSTPALPCASAVTRWYRPCAS